MWQVAGKQFAREFEDQLPSHLTMGGRGRLCLSATFSCEIRRPEFPLCRLPCTPRSEDAGTQQNGFCDQQKACR